MLVMLVRTNSNHIIATVLDSDLNRAVMDEPTEVKSWLDITDGEMDAIMSHYDYKFLGTFPCFKVNNAGDVTCIKS